MTARKERNDKNVEGRRGKTTVIMANLTPDDRDAKRRTIPTMYQRDHNLHEYQVLLGKIKAIRDSFESANIYIVCDFNVEINKPSLFSPCFSVFHFNSLSEVCFGGSKGSVVSVTKPGQTATLGNDVDNDPVLFHYFKEEMLANDPVLLPTWVLAIAI